MACHSRAYDNQHGEPVVVLVIDGDHDVSRLVALLARGNCEQVEWSDKVLRQVRRHNGGRAALRLLAAHGGPDFTDDTQALYRRIHRAICDPARVVPRELHTDGDPDELHVWQAKAVLAVLDGGADTKEAAGGE